MLACVAGFVEAPMCTTVWLAVFAPRHRALSDACINCRPWSPIETKKDIGLLEMMGSWEFCTRTRIKVSKHDLLYFWSNQEKRAYCHTQQCQCQRNARGSHCSFISCNRPYGLDLLMIAVGCSDETKAVAFQPRWKSFKSQKAWDPKHYICGLRDGSSMTLVPDWDDPTVPLILRLSFLHS